MIGGWFDSFSQFCLLMFCSSLYILIWGLDKLRDSEPASHASHASHHASHARQMLVPSLFSFLRLLAVSQRFGNTHSQIPSVLGIPFSYYCSVLGIPRYPPGMPKSLVFWSSPPKKCWISRENRKRFRDGFR